MAVEQKEKEEKPAEAKPAEAKPAEAKSVETDRLADLIATVSTMGKQLDDLSAAITAIANQGSVGESIKQDNHETEEEDYPTIDIDGINRLLGV